MGIYQHAAVIATTTNDADFDVVHYWARNYPYFLSYRKPTLQLQQAEADARTLGFGPLVQGFGLCGNNYQTIVMVPSGGKLHGNLWKAHWDLKLDFLKRVEDWDVVHVEWGENGSSILPSLPEPGHPS